MSVNTKIDGLALREAKRALRSNVDRRSQPRRSIASGYVATIHEDASGKIVAASVKSSGSTIRVQVPYGQNIYVGMTVQIENYGSHSQASWAISGSASLPAGTSGGIVYNQNGSNVLMFDNIWVVDGGFIRAGGTEDPDGNPTGSRTEMTELGFFGWDAYDRRMLGIFTRDEAPIGDDDPFITGDAYIGYMDGGRFQVSAQNQRMGIYNGDEVILQFDPETGNRITKNLWVGDDAGPQVGIGKWSVGGEDVSVIVARNAGSGDVDQVGNEPRFMVSAAPSKVTLHVGDPDHSENYIFYDSTGEGLLTVDAHMRARSITLYGEGLISEDGYIAAKETNTLAGIWLRDRYLEGRGTGGDRTFLLTAASIQLDRHPYDPSYGSILWDGGEGYLGDVVHKHFRFNGRGANGIVGLFNGEDMKVGFDFAGNGYFDGTIYATGGEIAGNMDVSGTLTVDPGSIIAGGGNVNVSDEGIRIDGATGKFTSASIDWTYLGASVFSVGTVVDLGVPTAGYVEAVDIPLVLTGEGVTINPGSGSLIVSNLSVSDDNIIITTSKTPASAVATGTAGMIAWDSGFLYCCIATDTWRRVAIAGWI